MANLAILKKTVAGGLAALTLATSVVTLSSTSASAQWRYYHHRSWGPGIAAGIIGGLAAGALAAGAYGPYYYGPGYGPGPYYYPGPYAYAGCYFAPRRVWNGYRWVIRRVEICG